MSEQIEKLDPHFCAQNLSYKDSVVAAGMYKADPKLFPIITKCWDCQTKIMKVAMLDRQMEMIAKQTRWDLQLKKPRVVTIQAK